MKRNPSQKRAIAHLLSLIHIFSGTDADGWYIEEAKKALEDGSISFAGKYSAPDYELILSKNCGLAVESVSYTHLDVYKRQ